MNIEIFSLISGKISPSRSEMVEILQGLKFPSPPCNPEDLQDCHHQFGDLDKWAFYLDALEPLEPLALWCCVVCVVWCGWVGLVKGMHFSQSKNALLLNSY